MFVGEWRYKYIFLILVVIIITMKLHQKWSTLFFRWITQNNYYWNYYLFHYFQNLIHFLHLSSGPSNLFFLPQSLFPSCVVSQCLERIVQIYTCWLEHQHGSGCWRVPVVGRSHRILTSNFYYSYLSNSNLWHCFHLSWLTFACYFHVNLWCLNIDELHVCCITWLTSISKDTFHSDKSDIPWSW